MRFGRPRLGEHRRTRSARAVLETSDPQRRAIPRNASAGSTARPEGPARLESPAAHSLPVTEVRWTGAKTGLLAQPHELGFGPLLVPAILHRPIPRLTVGLDAAWMEAR